MDHKHPLLDFSKITPLIYIGTNACCSVHFEERLLQKGIRADISLEKGRVDLPLGADYYLWLPTIDHTAPSVDKLELGVSTLQFLASKKIPVYVHCKNGHGRAPTLVAAYFIATKKMPADEAIALIKEKRPGVHIEPAQRKALQKFEKQSHLPVWNK
jgi:hypothetical protein